MEVTEDLRRAKEKDAELEASAGSCRSEQCVHEEHHVEQQRFQEARCK